MRTATWRPCSRSWISTRRSKRLDHIDKVSSVSTLALLLLPPITTTSASHSDTIQPLKSDPNFATCRKNASPYEIRWTVVEVAVGSSRVDEYPPLQ
jgi:hypothetical protein